MNYENGYGTTTPVQPATYPEGYYDMVKHVLLLLLTCGIWNLIWIYKTTEFLNRVQGEVPRNATNQLLLCFFVPFYMIYWVYVSAQRVDKLAAEKGVSSDLTMTCLLCAIFIYILAPIFMQDKINSIVMPVPEGAQQRPVAQPAPVVQQRPMAQAAPIVQPAPEATTPVGAKDVADELKTYKDLLDSGIITQEEFDAKKKQILGL